MYNFYVFDKVKGEGFDFDYLDDGRVIIDKLSSSDFESGERSWRVKKK